MQTCYVVSNRTMSPTDMTGKQLTQRITLPSESVVDFVPRLKAIQGVVYLEYLLILYISNHCLLGCT